MNIIATPAFSNKKSNPYNFLLYQSIQKKGVHVEEKFSLRNLILSKVWHIHWPESFLSSKSIFSCLIRLTILLSKIILAKLFGLKIIWTVHNLSHHEHRYPFIEKIFYMGFPLICSGFIFLSQESMKPVGWVKKLNGKSTQIIFHGDYKGVLTCLFDKKEAQRQLNLEKFTRVYLFFGLIRDYKGVPHLIREFIKQNNNNYCLCIVGSTMYSKPLKREINELAKGQDNIIINDKFVDDKELQLWVSASDLIVLPYNKVTNSGSVLYALSAGRPVIAPRIGVFEEIKDNVGDWVFLYEGGFKGDLLNEKLIDNCQESTLDLSSYEWGGIADQTVGFYKKVLANR